MSEQQAFFNSEFIPPVIVKMMSGEQLSAVEMQRFRAYFRGFNRNMDNQLWLSPIFARSRNRRPAPQCPIPSPA